jgi:hypothetical protein
MNAVQKYLVGLLAMVVLLSVTLPVLSSEIHGTIAKVYPDKREFVLADDFNNMTFRLAQDGKVLINGQPRALSDLRLGDEATVVFEKMDQMLIARVVQCTRH